VSENVVVHRAGEGPGTWAMGSLFEHLLSAGETAGRFAMSLVTQPPGIATPLHRHTHEAEALFVLEGDIEYRAG
jgi:quercetin dioxygenase-like cupin family protein